MSPSEDLRARPLVEVLREEVLAEWVEKFGMAPAEIERAFGSDLADQVKERLRAATGEMLGKAKKQPHEDRTVVALVKRVRGGVRAIGSLKLPLRFNATWRALNAAAKKDPNRIAAMTLGTLAKRATAIAGVPVSVKAAHMAVNYLGPTIGLIEIIVAPVPKWEGRERQGGRFLTIVGEYVVHLLGALNYEDVKARITATPPPELPGTVRQREWRRARALEDAE